MSRKPLTMPRDTLTMLRRISLVLLCWLGVGALAAIAGIGPGAAIGLRPDLGHLFPPLGESWRLAEPVAREGRAQLRAEVEDPRNRRGRLGQAQGGLGAQRRRARGHRHARDPEGPCRRRVVQGRRPDDRLQHLLQQQVVHEHGVRPDPRRLRQRQASRRPDADCWTPRYATNNGFPSRSPCPIRARPTSPCGTC